jgi:hypothetical protein
MAQGQGGAGAYDPQMRASDADRERLVEQLREHHAAGRLTLEEFDDRMAKAYSSRTYGELRTLTRDLPVDLAQLNIQAARQSQPRGGSIEVGGMNVTIPQIRIGADRHGRVARRGHHPVMASFSSWVALSVLLSGIWLISNLTGGHDWSDFWPIWPIGITGLLMLTKGIRGGR